MRCFNCERKTKLMSMCCKWCKNNFCIHCLPIEIHLCTHSDLCKSAKQELLHDQLYKNKTQSDGNYVKI